MAKYLHICVEEAELPRRPSPAKRRRGLTVPTLRSNGPQFAMHLWCFNPALAFRSAFAETRSVIVASGTMSPFGTFTGELDTAFPLTLEGRHVVLPRQLFAYALSSGPSGHQLKGVRATFEDPRFRQEMGQVVLGVCRTVPHGVLVFFPSYGVMRKMREEWEGCGLAGKLSELKGVFWEPQAGSINATKADFDAQIAESKGGGQGALLLAVCRGKVSEGIDFPDEAARAVVAIGIPFPALMDPQVVLKKAYNDLTRASGNKLVLSGDDWYGIQAYRALNQVLGRCIRHKQDWGAVILPDVRFQDNRPRSARANISKWIQSGLQSGGSYDEFIARLGDFVGLHSGTPERPELPSPRKETPEPAPGPDIIPETPPEDIPSPTKPGLAML